MNIVKIVLSMFLVTLCFLTVLGFIWWGHPPEKLAASASGGRFILVLTLLGCVVGLAQLWRGEKLHDS